MMKTPEEIDERRAGALKGVLLGLKEGGVAIATECAKIEALFLIAEQLAALNAKLDTLTSVSFQPE